MAKIEQDQEAVQAARQAAIGALRSAGLVGPTATGDTGLSVIETPARPRGAAVIITLGGPDPLEVCEALDAAGVGCDYAAEEPWRIYVLAPGDAHPTMEPADVVDEHEHEVEDDGGDEEFEEVGTAAPLAVGISLDPAVARAVLRVLNTNTDNEREIAQRLARRRAKDANAVTAERVSEATNFATLLTMGTEALATAIAAFDERVASVTESEA